MLLGIPVFHFFIVKIIKIILAKLLYPVNIEASPFHEFLLHTGSECCQESGGNSFSTVLEALTKELLLSTQNLVKTNITEETREEETEEEQNKEDIDQRFQEGLLKKHLSEGIDSQLEMFNIPMVNLNVLMFTHVNDIIICEMCVNGMCLLISSQILHLVKNLEDEICAKSNKCEKCHQSHQNIEVSSALFRCLPLLIQYTQMYQCMVTHTISAHRSTAKLLSVLLAIFTELTLKVRKLFRFKVN